MQSLLQKVTEVQHSFHYCRVGGELVTMTSSPARSAPSLATTESHANCSPSASFGATATATVPGDTTGYAAASGGATTTVTETDTSSVLTSNAPVPGGMGFGYDADGNWVASLNFIGTDKMFSNIGNG